MMKKLFLLMIVALIGGCTNLVKNPTNIKKSFVQINKKVEVQVCGENSISKSNECKTLITMNSTGSGSIVWNEYEIGGQPRTLVLTADHICESKEYTLQDFDQRVVGHIKENLGFKKEFKFVSKPTMKVLNSQGKLYPVKEHPWIRNVAADTCIVETSINAPSLSIGSDVSYGEKVTNIAAPKGIFFPNSGGGGVFFTQGLYNGQFVMQSNERGNRLFSMYNLSAAPGSSGSPILNSNGEIIGMIHSIDSRYCNLITSQCNSPVSYSATLDQIKDTLASALAAIKRGQGAIFDYKKIGQ